MPGFVKKLLFVKQINLQIKFIFQPIENISKFSGKKIVFPRKIINIYFSYIKKKTFIFMCNDAVVDKNNKFFFSMAEKFYFYKDLKIRCKSCCDNDFRLFML